MAMIPSRNFTLLSKDFYVFPLLFIYKNTYLSHSKYFTHVLLLVFFFHLLID